MKQSQEQPIRKSYMQTRQNQAKVSAKFMSMYPNMEAYRVPVKTHVIVEYYVAKKSLKKCPW
jgi:hypothetical protein